MDIFRKLLLIVAISQIAVMPKCSLQQSVSAATSEKSSYHECGACKGSGRLPCYVCGQSGHQQCMICFGTGQVRMPMTTYYGITYILTYCTNCVGKGRVKCSYCKGNGYTKCDYCAGTGDSSNMPNYGPVAPANPNIGGSSGVGSGSVYNNNGTKCAGCGGTGRCTMCKGRGGWVDKNVGMYTGEFLETWINCPECNTTGQCQVCHGKGVIR